MVAPGRALLAGLVELDETTIPLRRKDEPPEGGHGRSPRGKMLAAARAEGRIGGRRKKLDAAKRREIAESVITGRPVPRWPGSTTSARRPCHELSPNIGSPAHSSGLIRGSGQNSFQPLPITRPKPDLDIAAHARIIQQDPSLGNPPFRSYHERGAPGGGNEPPGF